MVEALCYNPDALGFTQPLTEMSTIDRKIRNISGESGTARA
jgi:hypothetical protein